MKEDAARVGRLIADIQRQIRDELLDELVENEDELETLFDPNAYTSTLEEMRDRYVDKLQALQGILHEVANTDEGHRRRRLQVKCVAADSPDTLTMKMNKGLRALEGCAIVGINFHRANDHEWVAFVTYVANPFDRSQRKQMQDQDRE